MKSVTRMFLNLPRLNEVGGIPKRGLGGGGAGDRTTKENKGEDEYKCSTLDLCLEIDSSWPRICGAEIHIGLGPHYPSQYFFLFIIHYQPLMKQSLVDHN